MFKKFYLITLLILLCSSISGCLNQKPSDSKLIGIFESITKCKFPKSGGIIEKNNLTGLNDGWEAAIIKVKDTVEFEKILENINKDKIMTKRSIGKYGFGFSSKLANGKTNSLDSVYYTKELFILGIIKSENIIVIEKEW
ncbi:hypothetical protein [Flavicella marina]|uniref:hypothetical protein n=1 Tax=Flavicella marina TaxID=1475951 RepID=UPI001265245B|nr:hypothetical protein [Flavicella marina]